MHVFILNVHPSAELGDTLQQILASACTAHIDHFKQPTDRIASRSEFCDTVADRIRAADIAFLLIPSLKGSGIDAMVASLFKIKQGLPVIMVSDVTCPDTVMQYLRSGISDYLTPPLRAIDILPRIWRLVDHAQRRSSPLHMWITRGGHE